MAYDNSNVEIQVGGLNSHPSGAGFEVSSARRTVWIETSARIKVSGDDNITTLTTIKCGWRVRATATFVDPLTEGAYMMVLRDDGSGGFDVIHRIDVTTEVEAVAPLDGYNTITKTGLSLAVQDGDYLAAWCASNLSTTTFPTYIDTSSLTGSFGVKFFSTSTVADFAEGENLPSGSISTQADRSLTIEGFATDNTKLVSNDATGYTLDTATYIPAYTATPYWIVLEDVNIPDGEDFAFTLSQYTSAWANDDLYAVTVDTATPDITDGVETDTLEPDSVSGAWKLNIYVWYDPANAKIELYYQNMRGTSLGTEDTYIYSLQNRVPASLTAGDLPNRISFTGTAGAAFDVDNVYVVQKPIVTLADSFFSAYSDEKLRQDAVRVGSRLNGEVSNLWSEDRFEIFVGSSGSNWQYTGSARGSIFDRWVNGDSCAMRDVVTLLWPSVNDIELVIDAATFASVVGGLAGSMGRAAAEASYAFTGTPAYGVVNDIIMAELIPQPSLSSLQKDAITEANRLIRETAFQLQSPFALTNDYSGGYSGVHPDADGSTEIAQKLVDAYESNSIARSPRRRQRVVNV